MTVPLILSNPTAIPPPAPIPHAGELVPTWPPPGWEERQYARLPWSVAQEVLGTGSGQQSVRAAVGWHGTALDEETGSFVMVSPTGSLADFVGERLRVSYIGGPRRRVITVYCHADHEAVTEDASLTRRGFLALAPLATGKLEVTVEVVAEVH